MQNEKLLRNTSNEMSSFPTNLLHIPRKMAGPGFKCPTRIVTTTKMILVHRALIQSDDKTNIVVGVLMKP